MALKRYEILIAVIVTFAAWALLTRWAPILRFLGYAFGIGTLFSFFVILAFVSLSIRKKRDYSRVHFRPTVAFITPLSWKEDTKWLSQKENYVRLPIVSTSVTVSDGVNELLEWILRDFVYSWYSQISHSSIFMNRIDEVVRDVLLKVKARLESQDIVEVVILRFVPLITNHLKDFYDAEQAVRGKKLNRNVTESEELDLAIASKYRGGQLHPAASLTFLDTRLLEREYLRKLVVRVVPNVLSSSMVQSRTTMCLIREILSCAVLGSIMELLSDPDTWNRLLEAYGRTVLQDHKTVRKLRAALDQHASPAPKVTSHQTFLKLSPTDDERKFERFIRFIRQCNNLSDARRFRNEVASQLKRESRLEGQDRTYIRRLETGRQILDQKIGTFSSVGGSSRALLPRTGSGGQARFILEDASLRELLHDASGLSCFMEYMDRQHLMTLVQFWIVVDGFRNPLENDVQEGSESVNATRSWTESERADIAQIFAAYLFKPELKVPIASRNSVREFLDAGRNASSVQYNKARSAILEAQTRVLEEMQDSHFPSFRNSDLFYKLLTSGDAPTKAGPRIIPGALGTNLSAEPSLRQPSPTLMREADYRGFLERNAASHSDLKSSFHPSNDPQNSSSRQPLDIGTSRPLFEDDVEPETLAKSVHGLDEQSSFGQQHGDSQAQIVEAMEAALNTIMSDGHQVDEARSSFVDESTLNLSSARDSETQADVVDLDNVVLPINEKKERPNLISLGLVNTSSRIGAFRDDDLFDDEEKFLEDEHADPDEYSENKEVEDEILEAAPGDLGLAEAVLALTVEIDRLVTQESIVNTLNRKAELTNNVTELRILSKSKSSLQREIHRKELQRQQYIVQESDNSLYGRAHIDIKSIMVGKEDDGQEFALYVIEVQRQAAEHLPAASWVIARRYSEFHDLHQRLRQIYPAVRQLDFPRRRLVMKLQREFLHRRRLSLQHYLRELLQLPIVCRSRDLRAFLSQRPILSKDDIKRNSDRVDIVSRIYSSVTDGMDEFLGNIPMLDQLSVAGQNLISAATSQYYNTMTSLVRDEPGSKGTVDSQEAQAELEAFENQATEPIVKPICDLFLETFELNRSQNWLRGRAIVMLLHQLLGNTVERRIREIVKGLTSDTSILKYLALAKDTVWPGGVLQRNKVIRTEAEKKMSRKEASVVLATLVPELAGGVVGRGNAQAAGRRIFATLNNSRLNAHLAYRLLDEVVATIFPTPTVR